MSPKHLLAGAAIASTLLAGCGGGGGTASGGKGRAEFRILWPAPSRYLPTYADKIKLKLELPGDAINKYEQTVTRPTQLPATSTVKFDELLKVGTYTVTGEATNNANQIVAKGSSTVKVEADKTATGTLTLGTTIDKLEILELPISVTTGASKQLEAKVSDAAGTVLLVPTTALTWSVTSGTAATISTAGLLQAVSAGTAKVRVSETGAAKFVEADITVSNPGAGGGLGDFGWSVPRGDIANTGRGQGSGAAGTSQTPTAATTTTGTTIGPGGKLYTFDGNGGVVCMNGTTGAVVWTFNLPTPVSGRLKMTGPPVVTGSVLAAAADGVFYKLNAETGAKQWEYRYAPGTVLFVPDVRVSQDAGTAYLNGPGMKLFAIDVATGAEKWTKPVDFGAEGSPAIDGVGNIYISADSGVAKLNPTNGSVVWSNTVGGSINPILLNGNLCYTITVQNKLVAVNTSDGTKAWEVDMGTNDFWPLALTPSNRIVTTSHSGEVKVFDAVAGGAPIWSRTLPLETTWGPSVATDGTMYFPLIDNVANKSYVRAIRASDGSLAWTIELTNTVAMEISIAKDGTLITGFPTAVKVR